MSRKTRAVRLLCVAAALCFLTVAAAVPAATAGIKFADDRWCGGSRSFGVTLDDYGSQEIAEVCTVYKMK